MKKLLPWAIVALLIGLVVLCVHLSNCGYQWWAILFVASSGIGLITMVIAAICIAAIIEDGD